MRPGSAISLPLVFPAIPSAQLMIPNAEIPLTPPAYQMLRFDEDYSCLTNQDNRTDLFDPVKYIPLRRDDPLWYLSFCGELRERVEGNYDHTFGIGGARAQTFPAGHPCPFERPAPCCCL